jgi:hypothetical protein
MRKALNSYLRIKGNESEKLSALEAQLKAELDAKTSRLQKIIEDNKGNY